MSNTRQHATLWLSRTFVVLMLIVGFALITVGAAFASMPATNKPLAKTGQNMQVPAATGTPTPTPVGAQCDTYITRISNGVIITATNLVPGSRGDDVTAPIVFPFPVVFYNVPRTGAVVSSNGNLQFTSNNTDFNNACLPVPTMNDLVAPFWDDLRTDQTTAQGIFTDVLGTAPNRQFVVQWVGCLYSSAGCIAGSDVNFEVGWSEANPGVMQMVYGLTGGNNGLSATSGVQRDTGSAFTQVSCNIDLLRGGMRVTYIPANGCVTSTATVPITQTATITPTATNTSISSGSISGTIYQEVGGTPSGTPTATPPCPPTATVTPSPQPTVTTAGAYVQACTTSYSYCAYTMTNTLGQYTLNGLPDGVYNLSVSPPYINGGTLTQGALTGLTISGGSALTGEDVVLHAPMLPPAGTSVSPGSVSGNGVPNVFFGNPFTLVSQGCIGGTATYQIYMGNTVISSGGMTESPAGTYSATVPALFPNHGASRVVITIVCPCGGTMTIIFDLYIDPSGNVRTVSGTPIAAATVTLYRSDTAGGPFVQVPNGDPIMSPENRTNPDITDANGHFGWDVLTGYYVVRAEKTNCYDPNNPNQLYVESGVLPIPPPVTNLDLRLACTDIATSTPTATPSNTPTATPAGIINGHLIWQGISQPNTRNAALTAILTLCVGGTATSYTVTTDQNGNFTLSTGLPNGSYNWRIKGTQIPRQVRRSYYQRRLVNSRFRLAKSG